LPGKRCEDQLLQHAGAAPLDQFARASAMSGTTLVVGTTGDDNAFLNDGSAYVFDKVGASWIQTQKLTSPFPQTGGAFGVSVAIDGNTLAVGAWSEAADNRGRAYIFERMAGSWVHRRTIDGFAVGGLPKAGKLGWRVAVSGNYVAVSSIGISTVFVFKRDAAGAGGWSNVPVAQLVGLAGQNYGASISMSGNILAIGAEGVNRVFLYDALTNFALHKTVIGPPAEAFACGRVTCDSVAIGGNTLAVGALGVDTGAILNHGGVYIYQRHYPTPNAWGLIALAKPGEVAGGNPSGLLMGNSVAIAGDLILAGALSDDWNGLDTGSAYAFQRNQGGANAWGQTHKLLASNGIASDWGGFSVAASGGTAFVGAKGYSPGNPAVKGQGYIHELTVGPPPTPVAPGYVLDAFGGITAGGGAAPVTPPTPYFGFYAAVALELANPAGVLVLDAFGGVHAGGGATTPPPMTPYFGFDVAADLEIAPVGYYVLDKLGGVHAGGGAPSLLPITPYFGFNIARDLELVPSGYYVLDGFGGVHGGGAAPVQMPASTYFPFDAAVDMELAATGFYVLGSSGAVHPGGGAPVLSPATPFFGFDIARDLELAPTGYYVLDGFGGVHNGGGAPAMFPETPFFGFDVARDLELR
jgi:hypothetical protein